MTTAENATVATLRMLLLDGATGASERATALTQISRIIGRAAKREAAQVKVANIYAQMTTTPTDKPFRAWF